jgi:hypothetical protein
VQQDWDPDELIVAWTLVEDRCDTTGFALTLKYFELEGEFPRFAEQLPGPAVEFVAGLVKVEATEFAKYSFDNRMAKYHRGQIREVLGFRPAAVADELRWVEWDMDTRLDLDQVG